MGSAHGDPLEQGVLDARKWRQLRLEGRCPTFWGPSIRSKEQKQNFGPKFAGKLNPESLRALALRDREQAGCEAPGGLRWSPGASRRTRALQPHPWHLPWK